MEVAMSNRFSFDHDSLLIANHQDKGTYLYENKGPKLRRIAVFDNEMDAVSVLLMAAELNGAEKKLEASVAKESIMHPAEAELQEQLHKVAVMKSITAERDWMRVERSALLAALKGIIDNTTVEFAAANGFGEERNKACEVYDRIMWGTPNAGGAQ